MSKAWADLERDTAEALGGVRIKRDLFQSEADVWLSDFAMVYRLQAAQTLGVPYPTRYRQAEVRRHSDPCHAKPRRADLRDAPA